MEFPILFSDNLKLRAVSLKDSLELEEIIPSDKNISVEIFICQLQNGFEKGEMINWGIIYNDELIGTCGYYRGFEDGVAEIGYIMRKAFQKRGLMIEALSEITRFAFEKLQINSIIAFTKEENIDSVSLLLKLGFVKTNIIDETERKFELLP